MYIYNAYAHVGMHPLFALMLTVWRSMHYIFNCSSYLKYRLRVSSVRLGDNHLILRGGGAGIFGRDRLVIFSTGSARKFISGYIEDRIFIFNRNKFFKTKKKWGGGRGSARDKKRRQDLAVNVLHHVMQSTCMKYSVLSCWNVSILIFSVFMCLIGSKRVVFEGGLGVTPPPELFLAVFIQNVAI